MALPGSYLITHLTVDCWQLEECSAAPVTPLFDPAPIILLLRAPGKIYMCNNVLAGDTNHKPCLMEPAPCAGTIPSLAAPPLMETRRECKLFRPLRSYKSGKLNLNCGSKLMILFIIEKYRYSIPWTHVGCHVAVPTPALQSLPLIRVGKGTLLYTVRGTGW